MDFRPLSELTERDRIFMELPELAPVEQIGINLTRLNKIAGIGGFATSVVLGSYEVVDKTDKDALAEPSFPFYHEQQSVWGLAHSRPPLTIFVNNTEARRRVEEEAGWLDDPDAWSKHLNHAIGHSLRKAAWEHYVHHPQYGEASTSLGSILTTAHDGIDPLDIAFSIVVNSPVRAAALWLVEGRQEAKDMCWSLSPVVHHDRALLVSGLTRALKIVKKIDPTKSK